MAKKVKELTNDDMNQVFFHGGQIQEHAKKMSTYLLGKDIIITSGKYRGRRAKIEAMYLDRGVKVFARPYNLNDTEFRTTLNDSEARRLRPLNEICPVEEWKD